MSVHSLRRLAPASPFVVAAVAALLSGCATVAPPAPAPVAAAAASGPAPLVPSAAARPAGAPAPAPFAEVTRGATSSAGFFTVWTKDDKTWIEIPAERLDKPFFFTYSLAGGLGEGRFLPGLMDGGDVVVLRRVGNSVQMVARNLSMRAPDGSPLAQAVGESYAESLLGAAPLAAAPHAERKSLLVDAQLLLGTDFAGDQTRLEATFRVPYALDRANSSIERARTSAGATSLTLRSHFSVPKLPAPPAVAPPSPAALARPPRNLPEPRSLFLTYVYTMAPLPAQPMRPRLADQRVGYFATSYLDLAQDQNSDRRSHLIHRWRLEKKDPAAAVSEPKQPIRVVMDRNIPLKWRPVVRDAVLEWNKAFERAGFRDAITVEQQADDAEGSSLEGTRMLAVRWFSMDTAGALAVGPSQADLRTGELLRGAVLLSENWVRWYRTQAVEQRPPWAGSGAPAAGDVCSYGADAADDAAFGMDLLALRGDIDPTGPSGDAFVAQGLREVTMHEMGHALGLRHNFRASTGITAAQLRDPAFTAAHGVSNSVMDYNALNLPLQGEAIADYHQATLGAYDYWAIEYGYREFPAETEREQLARLAGRSDIEPALAYDTDQDTANSDPMVTLRDLGSEPLAFAQRQIRLVRELWARTGRRELAPDDDMSVYRRNLVRGLNFINASAGIAYRHLGGTYTSRVLAGAKRPLWVPIPAPQQRAALDLLTDHVLAASSFRFSPQFMARLGIDRLDRDNFSRPDIVPDFNLAEAVLNLQRGVLDGLASEALAARMASAEYRVDDPRTLLSFADVQQRVSGAVWAELKTPSRGAIDSLRRNLQREHVRRVAAGLVRAQPATAADVRAVNRQVALQLQAQLTAALASNAWNAITRAHLADSLAALTEALRAPMNRQA